MLDGKINNDEILYRAIKTFPNWRDSENNRPASAAFKDSRGVSVDRQGTRDEPEVIKDFKKFELKAVVSITAKECRNFGTHPIYKPELGNEYHSEIHGSPTEIQLTASQAKKLSRNVKIVFTAG